MHPAPFDPALVQSNRGLPGEHLLQPRVAFHAPTSTAVLSFGVVRQGIHHGRVYLCAGAEVRYRPALELESEDLSLDSALVSAVAPYLFFVRSRWVGSGATMARAGEGVVRLELRTGEHDLWQMDAPGAQRWFVAGLVGASPDARELYAVCGFRAPSGIGAVEYALATLDWSTRTIVRHQAVDAWLF
jgi:hypothetical protein